MADGNTVLDSQELIGEETLRAMREEGVIPTWDAIEANIEAQEKLRPRVWNGSEIFELSKLVENGISRDELEQTKFKTRGFNLVDPLVYRAIFVGVQSFPPGDRAINHRHPHFAPRFVVDGHPDMISNVGGEELPSNDHDLIVTPSWEWHAHHNKSDETATWLTISDIAFIVNKLQLTEEEHSTDVGRKPAGYYETRYGPLRPPRGYPSEDPSPPERTDRANRSAPKPVPRRYAWADCYERLTRIAEAGECQDPYDGVTLEYVNPATGSPPLSPTLAFQLQLLRNETTDAHVHNSTEFYYVIRGSGSTELDDRSLRWEERDFFFVPPDTPHRHSTDSDETILLGVSDRPILGAFNLYREHPASL